MADNVNDSLKNLNQNIKDADANLAKLSKDFNVVFTEAVNRAARDAKVSIDQMFDAIAGRVGASKASKLKLLFDIVDEHGKTATPQTIQQKIDRIVNATPNARGTKLHIGMDWVDVDTANANLRRYKEQLKLIQDMPAAYDLVNRAVNAIVSEFDKEAAAKQKIIEKNEKILEQEIAIEEKQRSKAAAQQQKQEEKQYKEEQKWYDAKAKADRENERRAGEAKYRQMSKEVAEYGKALQRQIELETKANQIRRDYNKIKSDLQGVSKQSEEYKKGQQVLQQYRQELHNVYQEQKKIDNEYKGTRSAVYNQQRINGLRQEYEQLRRNGRQIKENKSSLESILPTLRRLASAFGVAFSVQGLVNFGRKLVETRGEFELQQVALRSILQNKQLADEIWDKTMQAALQSPFTAMQLTKYTKQLAAYRIETDKLFDTTKRLADVSAGLGVDMQRLILAYGQVKAANYLRASEIRQFTEAGVNVLGELTSYFNDTRDGMYNTAKVMDMVQKRMVKFEDVEAIFKRMTDEGGIFFNMQYIQSQTVKGQINKLRDAYDQMLNSIGKANEGPIKNMVSLLLNIVKNWREWKTVLDSILWPALTIAVIKFGRGLLMVDASAKIASKSLHGLTLVGAKVNRSLSNILNTLRKFPVGGIWGALGIGAAMVAVTALVNHANAVAAINKEYDEQKNRLRETARSLEDYQRRVNENNETIKNRTKIAKDDKEAQDKLKKAQQDNKTIVNKLTSDYPEFAKSIKLASDKQADLGTIVEDTNNKLRNQIALLEASKGDFFTQDLKTNIAQYQSAVLKQEDEVETNYTKAQNAYEDFVDKREKSLSKLKQQYEDGEISLRKYKKAVEKLNKETPDKWITGVLDAGKDAQKQRDFLSSLVRLPKGVVIPKGEITNYGVDEFDKDLDTREKDLRKNLEGWSSRIRTMYVNQLEKLNGGAIDDVKSYVRQNGTLIDNWFKYGIGAGWKDINESVVKIAESLGISTEEARKIVEEEINKTLMSAYGKTIKLDWSKVETDITEQETQEEKQAKIDAAWRRRIQLLEEMKKRYDELSKSAYGYAKSNSTVRKEFEKSWGKIFGKTLSMDAIAFMSASDMEAAFETLLSKAGAASEAVKEELQKKSDSYGARIPIDVQIRIREDFGRQMEEAFGNYELTLELQKLNLPKGLAAELWGIQETDMQALREQLTSLYEGLKDEKGQLSVDAIKDYEKFLNKIDDLERKQQRERLKDYSKYLEYQYSERVKLEMDYVRKVAQLEAETGLTAGQKKAIREGIDKEYKEKSRKQDWEDFKGSEFYVQMMEDLERHSTLSLEVMRKRLLEMRANAENLSPRDLKEVVNALEKIDKLEAGRKDPFVRWKEALDAMRGVEMRDVYEELAEQQKKLAGQEEEQRQLESMIALEQERNRLTLEGYNIDKARKELKNATDMLSIAQIAYGNYKSGGSLGSEQLRAELAEDVNKAAADVEKWKEIIRILSGQAAVDAQKAGNPFAGMSIADMQKRRTALKEEIEALKNDIDKNEELTKKQKELNDATQAMLESIKGWAQSIGDVYDSVLDTLDYFNDSTTNTISQWKELGSVATSSMNSIVDAISAYEKANAAAMMNPKMATGLMSTQGVALMLSIVAVIAKLITSIAKINDSWRDKEIEQQQRRIDSLTDAYARLERQIERTWDSVSYMSTYNQQMDNLRQQVSALQAQRAAEEAKKDTDEEKVRGYTNSINDAYNSMEDLRDKQREVFGGVDEGSYRSVAEGFVEAWKSAFLETGDGLQALQDHFDEFLQDWFVKQATMQGVSKYYKSVFDYINNIVDTGNVPTTDQIENARQMADDAAIKADEFMRAMAGIFGINDSGSLSGLAAGIQGMTEEQANILEAYWNSVRMYTASIDMNVARIANVFGAGGAESNPMLQQMSLIAANVQATHQLLQSVTKSGHSQGGYGIKVFND